MNLIYFMNWSFYFVVKAFWSSCQKFLYHQRFWRLVNISFCPADSSLETATTVIPCLIHTSSNLKLCFYIETSADRSIIQKLANGWNCNKNVEISHKNVFWWKNAFFNIVSAHIVYMCFVSLLRVPHFTLEYVSSKLLTWESSIVSLITSVSHTPQKE